MISKVPAGKDPVLTVHNQHVAKCGDPPTIDATGKYVGYYENEHGEQWVLIADRSNKSATLYGGDVSWKPLPISARHPMPDTTLDSAEAEWLLACLSAAFCLERDEIVQAWSVQVSELKAEMKRRFPDMG